MSIHKRVIRFLPAVALLLGAAMLQPPAGADPSSMSTYEWMRTAASAAQDSKCADGEECVQLCERFGGYINPLNEFQCQ